MKTFHIPSPGSKRRARIEIIPLIDIMFFLLATFVMVSLSMVKSKGVPVHLPAAASSSAENREEAATITVTADNGLLFDRRAISLSELPAALEKWKRGHSEPAIFINGDERSLLGVTVSVLDAVRRAGIGKVAFETRPPEH